jgi:hypothetical protein
MSNQEVLHDDNERLQIFFTGLQGLTVGRSDPIEFEDKLRLLATRPPFEEVFSDIAECRKLLMHSKPDFMDDAIDWAREHPGVPLEIEDGENLIHGRMLTILGSTGDQMTLEGVIIADDELIPVYLLPGQRTCIRATSQLD